jgi:ribosomal-protein-alanine N-acetyltransferase
MTNISNIKIFAETDRLILREILLSDLEGMYELDSDPEVHRYLGNKPVSDKTKLIEIINHVRQQYVDQGIGRWAIIDKENNEFIGWSGLKFVTELTNNHIQYYDLGYRIKRKYWGKGIGTETAVVARDYAFNTLNLEEIYAAANCENIGSNKILSKIGMTWIETFRYDDNPCNWYLMRHSDKYHPIPKL